MQLKNVEPTLREVAKASHRNGCPFDTENFLQQSYRAWWRLFAPCQEEPPRTLGGD